MKLEPEECVNGTLKLGLQCHWIRYRYLGYVGGANVEDSGLRLISVGDEVDGEWAVCFDSLVNLRIGSGSESGIDNTKVHPGGGGRHDRFKSLVNDMKALYSRRTNQDAQLEDNRVGDAQRNGYNAKPLPKSYRTSLHPSHMSPRSTRGCIAYSFGISDDWSVVCTCTLTNKHQSKTVQMHEYVKLAFLFLFGPLCAQVF
jgi:hypothetical protein